MMIPAYMSSLVDQLRSYLYLHICWKDKHILNSCIYFAIIVNKNTKKKESIEDNSFAENLLSIFMSRLKKNENKKRNLNDDDNNIFVFISVCIKSYERWFCVIKYKRVSTCNWLDALKITSKLATKVSYQTWLPHRCKL